VRRRKRKAYAESTEDAEFTEKSGEEDPKTQTHTPCLGRPALGSSDFATIPPLHGPTRQKAARKRKSGRSGRDDNSKMAGHFEKMAAGQNGVLGWGTPVMGSTARFG